MMFGQQPSSHRILKRLAKALVRLRVCAGWSEPLLIAHTTLLEISCHGSHIFLEGANNVNTEIIIHIIETFLCIVGNP